MPDVSPKNPRATDTQITINGVDLSAHVKAATLFGYPMVVADEPFGALKASGPIMLSGYFDDAHQTCSVCGERFAPGPEGTAILTNADTDEALGVVCPACGTALVAPRE